MSRHAHNRNKSRMDQLTNEELEREYDVTINDDGSVYDRVFERKFTTFGEWEEFILEQEEQEYSEHFGHGKQDYRDYY